MKTPPGIYKLPMAEYLKLEAVSAGIIRATVDQCPAAGKFESWLNPTPPDPDDTDASDKGSIAHEILLEGSEACCEIIDPNHYPTKSSGNIPDGWTNKDIRNARDNARAAGKIPILAPAMLEIRGMVASAKAFIATLKESDDALAVAVWDAFQPGRGEAELTVVWQDGPTLCRIRPDLTATDRKLIVDVKTTKTSAHPDAWGRGQLVKMGYYVSSAFYRRGAIATWGPDPDYVFLVIEQQAPYLCSLVGVDPHGATLGEAKVSSGLRLWQHCAKTNSWPAYPARVCYPELPAYLDAQFQEGEAETFSRFGSIDGDLGSQP